MADKADLKDKLTNALRGGGKVPEPQKTAVAPQKTAVAPQKTAVAQQRTAAAPPVRAVPPGASVPSGRHRPGETVKAGGRTCTVEKLLGSGAEGDIYVVNDHRRRYALKLCHPGFRTNAQVLNELKKLNGRGFITDIIDYGDDFELMDYIPEGSAASAGIKANPDAILAITLKTARVLDEMHKAGVIHKDVKPANILIKDTGSWDSVLCDFGIADLLDQDGKCATQQLRTPVYAAPEVYTDTVTIEGKTYIELTSKADFYSLGMTILSLWMGEGAFLQQERKMALDKTKGRITVPTDMPDPLAKICRGLLIRNPAKRWDLGEIVRTLNGEDVPVWEEEIVEDLNITYNASRHQIANTPEELADFMSQDPDLAAKYLYRGQIEKWLRPYPELVMEMQDIVENRYPKDHKVGVQAAIYNLDPSWPMPMAGVSRQTGASVEKDAVALKDVSNFCNEAIPDDQTVYILSTDVFKEWVRVRNKALADSFPASGTTGNIHLLRVQALDPLSDINLINDPQNPDYAMTQEGIARLLNKVYSVFWNRYGGDFTALSTEWKNPSNAPLNLQISAHVAIQIASSFMAPKRYHYVSDFLEGKGSRFPQQRSWLGYCLDYDSDDNTKKAGPKDKAFLAQSAWMKVVKGFGVTPEYVFVDSGEAVTTREELFAQDKKTLRKEFVDRGLRGWLAVQHQEDPNADLSGTFAYESLLLDYLGDISRIDEGNEAVQRFAEAGDEARKLLSSGKSRIRRLSFRSTLQFILTLLLAALPALILLLMLVFSIIETPIVDVSGFRLERFVWVLGIVIAGIIFFLSESEGCLVPIIGGVVCAFLLALLVKFLGQFILYFFAVIVLAVLVFFCKKTLFSPSSYARMARKFTKPGFDEEILEPLYYAFSDETSFDSSLNGAFNDDEIDGWRDDLKRRRRNMFIFIGMVWVLLAFSLLVPKSERFGRFSAPLLEWIAPAREEPVPDLLQFGSLEPDSRGDDVLTLQQYLKGAGYLKGAADGIYGKGTRQAVSAFQKANALPETGIADAATVQMINKLAAEAAAKSKEE